MVGMSFAFALQSAIKGAHLSEFKGLQRSSAQLRMLNEQHRPDKETIQMLYTGEAD